MRFIAKSPSAARPAIPARAALTSTILALRGFGARIRQRLRLVALLSCFLGVFGPRSWLSGDRAVAPLSGPRLRPCARPRPGHGPRTRESRGSVGLRTLAGGYIAGIPVAPRKSSRQRRKPICPSRRARAGHRHRSAPWLQFRPPTAHNRRPRLLPAGGPR